ncbi:MAG: hypothetical protein WC505_03405 [Patescibacteria group bacterium]
MAQPYAKQIKLDTTKQAVKSLLRTSQGKTVTDAKFNKEFLKKDKELRKYFFKSKGSKLQDREARQFVSKALKSAQASGKLKISALAAKKIGVHIGRTGEIGTASMKKLYGRMVSEDQQSTAKPNEPSPQELRQQKRHEKAVKAMHKRERSDEIRRDRIGETKGAAENKGSGASQQPHTVPRAGGGSFAQQQPGSNGSGTQQQDNTRRGSGQTNTIDTIPLVVLPLYNLSPNVDGLATIVDKLTKHILQTVRNIGIFSIVQETQIRKVLAEMHLDAPPPITDREDVLAFGRTAHVDLLIIGYVQQTGPTIEMNVSLVNTHDGRQMPLVSIKQDDADLYLLEQQIAWQMTHVLRGQITETDAPLPNPNEAQDMPI